MVDTLTLLVLFSFFSHFVTRNAHLVICLFYAFYISTSFKQWACPFCGISFGFRLTKIVLRISFFLCIFSCIGRMNFSGIFNQHVEYRKTKYVLTFDAKFSNFLRRFNDLLFRKQDKQIRIECMHVIIRKINNSTIVIIWLDKQKCEVSRIFR